MSILFTLQPCRAPSLHTAEGAGGLAGRVAWGECSPPCPGEGGWWWWCSLAGPTSIANPVMEHHRNPGLGTAGANVSQLWSRCLEEPGSQKPPL